MWGHGWWSLGSIILSGGKQNPGRRRWPIDSASQLALSSSPSPTSPLAASCCGVEPSTKAHRRNLGTALPLPVLQARCRESRVRRIDPDARSPSRRGLVLGLRGKLLRRRRRADGAHNGDVMMADAGGARSARPTAHRCCFGLWERGDSLVRHGAEEEEPFFFSPWKS